MVRPVDAPACLTLPKDIAMPIGGVKAGQLSIDGFNAGQLSVSVLKCPTTFKNWNTQVNHTALIFIHYIQH